MNIKKIIKIIFIIIFLILFCLIVFINFEKYQDSETRYLKRVYNIEFTKESTKTLETRRLVLLAIENYVSFDNLALTDNFKKKYKNGNDIVPHKWIYSYIVTYDEKNDGNELIEVHAEKYERPFASAYESSVTTVFCYECIRNENGFLDDMILLEKYDADTATLTPLNEID